MDCQVKTQDSNLKKLSAEHSLCLSRIMLHEAGGLMPVSCCINPPASCSIILDRHKPKEQELEAGCRTGLPQLMATRSGRVHGWMTETKRYKQETPPEPNAESVPSDLPVAFEPELAEDPLL